MFLHEAPLSLPQHTYTHTHSLRCCSQCLAHGIFLSEDGENREKQQRQLPADDLIYLDMTCLQLLLLALDATDRQQHGHMCLLRHIHRHIDTQASAKLTQSKWIKKGFCLRGSGCKLNLLRE